MKLRMLLTFQSIPRDSVLPPDRIQRKGMTLLELIIALALSAVVSVVVGTLVNTYLINQNVGKDRIEQAKLARLTLSMIADDLRSIVRPQTFDASGLEQILGSSSGSTSSQSSSTGDASGASSSGSTGSLTDSGASESSADSSSMDSGLSTGGMPPGLYGTETSIEFDISRLPRPDEYFPMAVDPTSGTLGDMPSDVKTVSYAIQLAGSEGVKDSFGPSERYNPDSTQAQTEFSGGLVRRSVDRAITQYAYMNSSSDSLLRTGELIAPEVVALEFQYFDGTMWQLQWDSSVLGLPAAVKVTIAVQRESKHQTMPYQDGGSLLNVTPEILSEYGMDLYSLNVTIPGVNLLPKPASSDSSTSSLGF